MNETPSRRAMHRRSIDHQTWLREDGILEIESRLVDAKAYDTRVGFGRELAAGQALHDMTINILLGPDGLIRAIRLRMDSAPFKICSEVIQRFETLRGASMGKGWNALLSRRFAGVGGCRHLVDLLRGMGTVAFQSMYREDWTRDTVNRFSDSCYAFRSEGPVMVRLTISSVTLFPLKAIIWLLVLPGMTMMARNRVPFIFSSALVVAGLSRPN